MKRLDTVLKRSNNNFDLIRLSAALMVVIGHSFYLFNTNGYPEPVKFFLKDDYSGSLAVYIFFFLSGLFITASFINSKTYVGFIVMRVFRIWPALIICIIFIVFIAGPLVSKYSLSEYFSFQSIWTYLISNTLLYRITDNLPGVFETNHYAHAVNGSLWTLPLEVRCYCLTFFLGIAGVFKNKLITVLIFLIFILYIFNFKLSLTLVNKQVLFFTGGSLFCVFKKYIIIDYKILIGLIIICGIFYSTLLFYIVLIYAVLVWGSSYVFKKVKLPGDYSYGIYIYGFLVQQLLAFYLPAITSYKSLLISVPCSILFASLSWHFIEYPSIKIGRKIAESSNIKKFLKHKIQVKD